MGIHMRITNTVLRSLSAKECQGVLADGEQLKLTYGDILCEPGKPIQHVYFPNSGVISLLTPLDGHESVEVGLVGSEGMAGMGLFLGVGVSPVQMLVQGTGTATRMTAMSFRSGIRRCPALRVALSHYLYTFMAQIAQTAACNRHHELGQRLARWLLMMHDRVQSNEFHLTQEFLAHMLGVRRVGVTRAAGHLQEKVLISYRRGNITIVNRKGLERASCRCYQDVNRIRDRMFSLTVGHSPA
jgi:CRP-like cAMP-binding protein